MSDNAALLEFIDSSPTPYHAAGNAAALLRDAGFAELNESEEWQLEVGKSYYIHRRDAALLAFRVPTDDLESFCLIGAHTDSPNLRLKPKPLVERAGWMQLGVEVYGGVLWNSWLDRDLGVAGRISFQRDGAVRTQLVSINKPICRVPQLAIHLDREVNEKGLQLNPQKHLPPVYGLKGPAHQSLWELIANTSGIAADEVLSFDLMLFGLEPSRVGGSAGEFLFAPRLDNLAMCHAGLSALIATPAASKRAIGVALFDHEEVGSQSLGGAGSPLLRHSLERVFAARGKARTSYLSALPKSLFVSADMAHAVHPNYQDRHDEQHFPMLNQGPVIKHNANQRYATDARSAAWFESLCRNAGIPTQRFVNRTDLACGSTIGPTTATTLGVPVIDVGAAMLSMHSCREMAGSADPALMQSAFAACFAG